MTDSRDGIAGTRCWNCGTMNDAATDAYGDARPEPGDASVCFTCGAVGIFDGRAGGAMFVRAPIAAEAAVFEADPNIRRVRESIRHFRE